jgi:hypothetical protein
MATGEAAGFAAALATREHTTPGQLDPETLVRTLIEHRQLVSFFNDLKVDGPQAWIPAVEYFGTKGFFPSYDARADQPMVRSVAVAWTIILHQLHSGNQDASASARYVVAEEDPKESGGVTAQTLGGIMLKSSFSPEFVERVFKALGPTNTAPLTRGAVCRAFYLALNP